MLMSLVAAPQVPYLVAALLSLLFAWHLVESGNAQWMDLLPNRWGTLVASEHGKLIGALVVAPVLLVGALVYPGVSKSSLPDVSARLAEWPKGYEAEVISGRTFINEKVVLDGFKYVNCTFRNVTFIYNGTTPAQMFGSEIVGGTVVESNSDVVEGAWMALYGLGWIKEDRQVRFEGNSYVRPPAKR